MPGALGAPERKRAVGGSHQIDPGGWPSQLYHPIRLQEILTHHPNAAKAKILESIHDSLRVFGCCPDEKVDVAGEPRMTVESYRVTTDDKEVNSVRVQQLDKLSQIGLQLRQVISGSVRRGRAGSPNALGVSGRHSTDRRRGRLPRSCERLGRLVPHEKAITICRASNPTAGAGRWSLSFRLSAALPA